MDGNYTHAGIYSIASEINKYYNCDFYSWATSAPPHALTYLSKSATNLFGPPITSVYQPLTASGVGGNGFNAFYSCDWQYGGSNSLNGICLIVDYGQSTLLMNPYTYSDGPTNVISLGESTVGLSIVGGRMEFGGTMPIGMHFRNGSHRDISISGSAMLPIYGETGSVIMGLKMWSSHWAGTNPCAIPVVNAWNLYDSEFDISEFSVPAGRWLTNGVYQARSFAMHDNFGQTPTNLVNIATNLEQRTVYTGNLDSYDDLINFNAQYLKGPDTSGSFVYGFYGIAGPTNNGVLHVSGNTTLSGVTFINYAGGVVCALATKPGLFGIGTNGPVSTLQVVGDNAQPYTLQVGTTNRPSNVTVDTNGVLAIKGTNFVIGCTDGVGSWFVGILPDGTMTTRTNTTP